MNQTVDDGYRCSGRVYNLNYSNQRLKRVKKGPTEDRVINSYSYRDKQSLINRDVDAIVRYSLT